MTSFKIWYNFTHYIFIIHFYNLLIESIVVVCLQCSQKYPDVTFPVHHSSDGDDFLVVHARDDFGTLHGTTPYTHSSPGTPINMPWLGGLQTGRGASVVSRLLMGPDLAQRVRVSSDSNCHYIIIPFGRIKLSRNCPVDDVTVETESILLSC